MKIQIEINHIYHWASFWEAIFGRQFWDTGSGSGNENVYSRRQNLWQSGAGVLFRGWRSESRVGGAAKLRRRAIIGSNQYPLLWSLVVGMYFSAPAFRLEALVSSATRLLIRPGVNTGRVRGIGDFVSRFYGRTHCVVGNRGGSWGGNRGSFWPFSSFWHLPYRSW